MNKQALKILSKDPLLKKVVQEIEPLSLPSTGNVFNELCRSVVYQLISYKAADSIYGRLVKLLGKEDYSPEELLLISETALRDIGLSRPKVKYLYNIAQFFIDKTLIKTDWSNLGDKQVIELLTEIKGVGEWTAQMILIFELKRPDVLPLKDVAIQNAMKSIYNIEALEKKALAQRMEKIASKWQPFRSLACLYLWGWIRNESR